MFIKPRSHIYCLSCNSHASYQFLYKKNDCVVRRCSVCGLGLAEPQDFCPEKYYTVDYFKGACADGYPDYPGSERVLRAEFSRVLRVLQKYCRPGGRLLEIGCAYGFFLKEAQASFEVHGIELAKGAVDACHRDGLCNVHQGIVDENTLKCIGSVDAIVMLDVIEHLSNPIDTLRHCSKILNPGGVILITTGDFGSFVARLTGHRWRLMTPPQHLWFFSQKSITNIATSLNLSIVDCTHPWKLVPMSLIQFQLARMLEIDVKTTFAVNSSRFGLPVNLYDAMRIVMRKPLSRELGI